MIKAYNEPEFKVVKVAREDVLTASVLETANKGWEADPIEGDVPFINL